MNLKNYYELSEDTIAEVEKALREGFSNYKLKDSDFNVDTFKNGDDIAIIQFVGEEEIELSFKTGYVDDKYYISLGFEIIVDDILEPTEARDIFQSVNMYFRNVIANPGEDFKDEKDSLINFLVLSDEKYSKDDLDVKLNPDKIRNDYESDHERIYSQEDLTDIQKSLALKELLHMSICEVIDDLELYFTRPLDLSPAEEHEKNRQEAKALENEMKLY